MIFPTTQTRYAPCPITVPAYATKHNANFHGSVVCQSFRGSLFLLPAKNSAVTKSNDRRPQTITGVIRHHIHYYIIIKYKFRTIPTSIIPTRTVFVILYSPFSGAFPLPVYGATDSVYVNVHRPDVSLKTVKKLSLQFE